MKQKYKEFLEEYRIFMAKFLSIRRPIRLIAAWSILWIILIELYLINIPSYNRTIYQIGQIHLRLCYSFISAFIFYLLAVHWPKENRKVKAYRLINNRVLFIDRYIQMLTDTYFGKPMDSITRNGLTRQDFVNQGQTINPYSSVSTIGVRQIRANDWYTLIIQIKRRIREDIHDVLVLNDSVDNDVLQSLTFINDIFTNFLDFEYSIPGNTDLSFIGITLHELNEEANSLSNNMMKGYRKYSLEYHSFFRRSRKK